MSRTTRRKNKTEDYYWVLRDYTHISRIPTDLTEFDRIEPPRWGNSGNWVDIHYSPRSPKGRRLLTIYHSDREVRNGRGPGWFHNLTAQRPLRQYARVELHKTLLDEEYEVIIPSKPKREYWD